MSYTLYSYWRSSAAWRVRIALELKGIDYQIQSVHLTRDGGQQHQPHYTAINPLKLVPSLRDGDFQLSQSSAICEYLEARHPKSPLLPQDPQQAAHIRSFCAAIACDTHPLNNLRVLQYLENDAQLDEAARRRWYQHWIARSFSALESQTQGQHYVFGDSPTLADCFLIPQLYNARRFDCPLQDYPQLVAIDAHCASLPAFAAAHPDNQIDNPDHARHLRPMDTQ